jgi:tRNA A22 N-methylase
LVDPSLEVIKSLNNKLIDSYITKRELIKIHYKKGQDVVLDFETKAVFIAGMGGKEIQKIMKSLLSQLTPADRIVISPHRNILELRKYLNASQFKLIDEVTLFEDGQYYQVLCLETAPGLPQVSLYGDKVWQGLVGEEYRQHQIRAFSLHQDEASKAFVAYLGQLSH